MIATAATTGLLKIRRHARDIAVTSAIDRPTDRRHAMKAPAAGSGRAHTPGTSTLVNRSPGVRMTSARMMRGKAVTHGTLRNLARLASVGPSPGHRPTAARARGGQASSADPARARSHAPAPGTRQCRSGVACRSCRGSRRRYSDARRRKTTKMRSRRGPSLSGDRRLRWTLRSGMCLAVVAFWILLTYCSRRW
jgi:hypothetical protein